MKFILHIILLIVVFIFVFIIIPQPFHCMTETSNSKSQAEVFILGKCSGHLSYYLSNGYLQGFYFLFLIYFLLSSFQLKFGYDNLKMRNSLLRNSSYIASLCVKTISAIPFLQELKVIMDWTFMKTSLDLFQWFKLDDISYLLYCAKIDYVGYKNI